MLLALRLPALGGGDDEQAGVDAADAGQHVAQEPDVARDVDEADRLAVDDGVGEAEVDRQPAALLLGEAVGVGAGERQHERRLAVVDVPGRGDHPHRPPCHPARCATMGSRAKERSTHDRRARPHRGDAAPTDRRGLAGVPRPALIRRWHGWDDDGLDAEIQEIFIDGTIASEDDRTLHIGGHLFALEARGRADRSCGSTRATPLDTDVDGLGRLVRRHRRGVADASCSSCASPSTHHWGRRAPHRAPRRRGDRRHRRPPVGRRARAGRRRRARRRASATRPSSPASSSRARCGSGRRTSSG